MVCEGALRGPDTSTTLEQECWFHDAVHGSISSMLSKACFSGVRSVFKFQCMHISMYSFWLWWRHTICVLTFNFCGVSLDMDGYGGFLSIVIRTCNASLSWLNNLWKSIRSSAHQGQCGRDHFPFTICGEQSTRSHYGLKACCPLMFWAAAFLCSSLGINVAPGAQLTSF